MDAPRSCSTSWSGVEGRWSYAESGVYSEQYYGEGWREGQVSFVSNGNLLSSRQWYCACGGADIPLSISQVKNHTVTKSSFEAPCSKLVDAYGVPSGFDSGLYVFLPFHLPSDDILTSK